MQQQNSKQEENRKEPEALDDAPSGQTALENPTWTTVTEATL